MTSLSEELLSLQMPGTSADKRLKRALEGDYFRVDEKSLDDHVAFASRFAALLNFHNLDDKPDGDWAAFFENDVTVLLMRIGSIDLGGVERQYELLKQRIGKPHTVEACWTEFAEAIAFLHRIFHLVEDWNQRTATVGEFNQEIRKLIEFRFSPLLSKLAAFEGDLEMEGLAEATSSLERFESSPAWSVDVMGQDPYEFEGDSPLERLRNALPQLDGLFAGMVASLSLILKSSSTYLREQLENSQRVEPHVALLVAFIGVYQEAQRDINRFTQRHLDYYFREVLRLTPQRETPDVAHLTLRLQQQVDDLRLPKGTAFVGGTDREGKPRLYRTVQEFSLNRTRIDQVKIFLNDNQLRFEPSPEQAANWDIFDMTRYTLSRENFDPFQRRVGFAVASRVLHLEEGTRRVKFFLDFTQYDFELFKRGVARDWLRRDEPSHHELNSLFKDFFYVCYTSDPEKHAEWVFVPPENVECSFQSDEQGNLLSKMSLGFLLEKHDPPVVPIRNNRYKNAAAEELPVFKFLINPTRSSLYNPFKALKIVTFEIEVDVLGVSDLIYQNDFGLLDASGPFQPFGPSPSLGANFFVGHKSIFNHPLNELYINLDWHELPLLPGGFPEHYSQYEGIDSNEIFRAKLQILHNKGWLPEENAQELELFETVELDDRRAAPVNNFRGMTGIDVKRLAIPEIVRLNRDRSFGDSSLSGFLRFELSGPPAAFGHKVYPDLVRKAAFQTRKGKEPPPLPNTPYTPSLKSLTIDYSTRRSINLLDKRGGARDHFFHLHPFGEEAQITDLTSEPLRLLPFYEAGTELYIGLENVRFPQTLNLLFQVDAFAADNAQEEQRLQWSYLRGNNWFNLADNQIITDSSFGLIQPGVLTFSFSKHMEFALTDEKASLNILPEQLFWLRCKSSYGAKFIRNFVDIQAQAVEVRLDNQPGSSLEHLETQLPPNSIQALAEDRVEVAEVRQPYPSFGGIPPEGPRLFYARVSERLRHKDRAISVWDYESLVLEHFKEVHIAKCLPNTDARLRPTPGKVLLVAIPTLAKLGAHEAKLPMLSGTTLARIQRFLSQRASRMVSIDVRNPNYEQVQVKFKVRFLKGQDERYCLKLLNDELRQLLSPWLHDRKHALDFTREVTAASILYFLEKRDYVDYIANFSIFHIIDGKIINPDVAYENDLVLRPSTPISVFVSADEHLISLMDDQNVVAGRIGDLAIGIDFIVEDLSKSEEELDEGLESRMLESDFRLAAENPEGRRKKQFRLRING